MKIYDLLQQGIEKLKNEKIESAILDAQLILAFVLNCDRVYLLIHKENDIEEIFVKKYFELIEKRVKKMPVSYILGTKEFMGLSFFVNENVLIPRPDTEILVEFVIEFFKNQNDKINILDIGTGSGAIAISLAKYIKNANLYAVDVSDDALLVAQKNASFNNVSDKIKFAKQDILKENIKGTKFDAIISNPPYIKTSDIMGLMEDVKNYEPSLALDGGTDGLLFYRHIINNFSKSLKKGGVIAFEVGFNQAEQVISLFENNNNFEKIEAVCDLASIKRVVKAIYKGA